MHASGKTLSGYARALAAVFVSSAKTRSRHPSLLAGISTARTARAGGKSLRRFAPFFLKKTTDHKNVDSRRPLTENVVSFLDPESRFYAVPSKAA
jgi:hypothetical protein